jgi:asparagine synthase (glutamine-hydrolysing)
VDLFERLDGMFAVALWDASDETLVLARDRAGIKPLYYAPLESGVLFASEPKSILRSGRVTPAVDEAALRYFLQLRYSPSRTTLFDGIETLLPGQYAVVRRTNDGWACRTHSYWSVADAGGDPPDDPASAVEAALRAAVERQLMSDVPVGFYLSGGLDTSSVVAMAAEVSDDPLETFCMGFADGEWDERSDARVVADHFGTNHHEITIDGDFVRDFPELIWHADEPKRNLYPYYVAREMSDHVSVALGGLGADELFGGYVYRYARLREFEQLHRTASVGEDSAVQSTASRVAGWQLTHGDLSEDGQLEDLGLLAHATDPARLYVLLNSTDVFGDVEAFDERVFGESLTGGPVPADRIRDRFDGAADESVSDSMCE